MCLELGGSPNICCRAADIAYTEYHPRILIYLFLARCSCNYAQTLRQVQRCTKDRPEVSNMSHLTLGFPVVNIVK